MVSIQYDYSRLPGTTVLRPVGFGLVVNPLNGKTSEFAGIIDSGSDIVILAAYLAEALGIDLKTLPQDFVGGIEGIADKRFCGFLHVGMFDQASGTPYFPNFEVPVPLCFSLTSPYSVFGHTSFLSRGIVTFDGPKQRVTLEF